MNNGDYFEKLYATYYSPEMRQIQDQVWQVLCSKFFAQFLPHTLPNKVNNLPNSKGVLVDLAAGGCNFINNKAYILIICRTLKNGEISAYDIK